MRIQQRINALEQRLGGQKEAGSIEEQTAAYLERHGLKPMSVAVSFKSTGGDKGKFYPAMPGAVRDYLWGVLSVVSSGCEAGHA